ncbi:pyridoxamine 5'-phosphate oxidase family protein [Seongchinamella sediminis]|uniref:Pyridoxamine 5'-phosphate oxidase family protein n=1 Tax=Seongchinamella sediminis TaxID=2283635 RepID=A0A3L7DZY0_9GAMM|nr:pyridoxamine 5'-phosphate oxidase family protein [Seongchinamella sediminis]RLQ23078.1 pyridoxamine 5'-phosphate oxidase family protein [Seongchinamella sediminis]
MEVKGPWDLAAAEQWLGQCAMPIRLACTGEDGFPRVVSVWFLYREGEFLSVSHRDSSLVKLLQSSPQVGFEVSPNEPPYHGVRGQGTASLASEGAGEVLRAVISRYLGSSNSSLAEWLLSREDEEVVIRVAPQRFFTWDYRDRMEPVKQP